MKKIGAVNSIKTRWSVAHVEQGCALPEGPSPQLSCSLGGSSALGCSATSRVYRFLLSKAGVAVRNREVQDWLIFFLKKPRSNILLQVRSSKGWLPNSLRRTRKGNYRIATAEWRINEPGRRSSVSEGWNGCASVNLFSGLWGFGFLTSYLKTALRHHNKPVWLLWFDLAAACCDSLMLATSLM